MPKLLGITLKNNNFIHGLVSPIVVFFRRGIPPSLKRGKNPVAKGIRDPNTSALDGRRRSRNQFSYWIRKITIA